MTRHAEPVTGDAPETEGGKPPQCSCMQDPFAALPPELRPRPASELNGLRKVVCPVCGLNYWTNRNTDLCVDCEKKARRRGPGSHT